MTAFSDVYDKFYELVETDSNFFQYFDLTENEVRDLVHDRAKSYLMESLSVITRNIEPEEDFSFDDYDSELEEFNSDLTFDEIDMLAHLMLGQSFNRFLIISLDVLICRYSPLLRAFPALFISEEPHKSFYYPSCFHSQK